MRRRRPVEQRVGVRGGRTPTRGARESGAVTAEAAVVMPVLVAVGLLMVWLVSVAATQVRVVDAAREAARAAARDESGSLAVAAGRRVAPAGARVSVALDGDEVSASVVAPVRGPGGLFAFLPVLTVRSTAIALREPR